MIAFGRSLGLAGEDLRQGGIGGCSTTSAR
jgi:hypothetical protein